MHASNPRPMSRRAVILGHGGAAAALAAGLAASTPSVQAAAANELHAAYHRLLDRYLAAINAHDTGPFPEIFTEAYVQHSGRSPSGLQAQIANFKRVFANWPDFQSRIEDRIFDGDKIVARVTFSATHTRTVLGFAPTGKRVEFVGHSIDRVVEGKIVESWVEVDMLGVMRQLGAEPGPGRSTSQ